MLTSLVVSMALQATAPKPELTACPTDDHISIPLYTRHNRALLMMRINEDLPVPAVFDTGTTGNAIDDTLANSTNLATNGTGTVIDGSTGVRFQVPKVLLPRLSFSGHEVCGQEASVYAYKRTDEVAIVGPNMFSGKLVYLELDRQRLRVVSRSVASPPLEPGRIYMHPEDDGTALPAIGIILPGGLEISAILDSGDDSGLSLPLEFVDQVPLEAPAVPVGVGRSVGGESPIYRGRIKGIVKVGPLSLENPIVDFIGHDGNVGYSLMKRMTIIMDPQKKLAWAVAAQPLTAAQAADYPGRYGMRTVRLEGTDLIYQRDEQPAYVLNPLGGDLFDIKETGDRIQFRRENGRVTGYLLITSDGGSVEVSRNK